MVGFGEPTNIEVGEKKSLVEELVEAISELPVKRENGGNISEIEKRQTEILNRLPGDFINDLLIHVSKWSDKYGNKTIKENGIDREMMAVLRGRIFEKIVELELLEKIAKETGLQFSGDVVEEILDCLKNPEIHGMGKIVYRNPDTVFLGLNESGKIEIKALGEAKSGDVVFGERTGGEFGQLSSFVFEENLRRLVSVISQLDKGQLKKRGLSAVAQRGGKISLAADLKRMLFVTADADASILLKRRDLKWEIFRSVFAKSEIRVITEKLAGKMMERVV